MSRIVTHLLGAIIGLVLLAGPTLAADPVELQYRLAVGDTYDIVIKKQKIRAFKKTEKPRFDPAAIQSVRSKVLRAEGENFVVRWVYGPLTSMDKKLNAHPLMKRINGLVDGLTIDYLATSSGEPLRVLNVEQARAYVVEAINRLFDPEGRQEAKALASFRDNLLEVYRTMDEETFHQQFLEEASLLHMVTNAEMVPGEPKTYDTTEEVAPGTPPAREQGSFALTSYDAEAGRATITWEQTLTMATGDMQVLIGMAGELMGKDIPATEARDLIDSTGKVDIARQDKAEFVIDARRGHVRSLTYLQLVSVAGKIAGKRRWITTTRVE